MLDNGSIAEIGTYNELINLNGKFREFVQNSFLKEEEQQQTNNKEEIIKWIGLLKGKMIEL